MTAAQPALPAPDAALPDAPAQAPDQPEDRRRRRKILLLLLLGILALAFLLFAIWYLLFREPISQLIPPTDRFAMPTYQWTATGVTKPVGIAVTADGSRIYVAESDAPQETVVFDNRGNRIGVLKPPADVAKQSQQLYVAVDPGTGEVYATDRMAGQVRVYSADGTYERLLDPGAAIGAWQPMAIAVDSKGHVFVANASPPVQRIHEFNRDGTFIRDIGASASLQFPNGLAVDGAGNLYVSDTGHGQVLVFDSSGKQVSVIARGQNVDALAQPRGIAIDGKDRLYVVDAIAQAVPVFVKTDGTTLKYVDRFGVEGMGAGAFEYPNGVAVDARGRVYVADWNNDRIQVWSY